MSKWIEFSEYPTNGVTRAFTVVPKENVGIYIGKIKWYAPWRKYAFFPEGNCVFETDCLNDIIVFINKLMLERKIKKQQ